MKTSLTTLLALFAATAVFAAEPDYKQMVKSKVNKAAKFAEVKPLPMTGRTKLEAGKVYVESYPGANVDEFGLWRGTGKAPAQPQTQVWDWCRRHPGESLVIRVGNSNATWRDIPKEYAGLPVVWLPLHLGMGDGVWLQSAKIQGPQLRLTYLDGTPFVPDADPIDFTTDGRSVCHVKESLYADQPLLWNGCDDCISAGCKSCLPSVGGGCKDGKCPVK